MLTEFHKDNTNNGIGQKEHPHCWLTGQKNRCATMILLNPHLDGASYLDIKYNQTSKQLLNYDNDDHNDDDNDDNMDQEEENDDNDDDEDKQ